MGLRLYHQRVSRLPGWSVTTALGLGVAATGLVLFMAGLCFGFADAALGSKSTDADFWVLAGLGYGIQLGVLGSGITLVSLGIHWLHRRLRKCRVWRSAP